MEQRLQPLALCLAQEHLRRGEEPSWESGQDTGEEEEGVFRLSAGIYMDTPAGIPGYGLTTGSGMTL